MSRVRHQVSHESFSHAHTSDFLPSRPPAVETVFHNIFNDTLYVRHNVVVDRSIVPSIEKNILLTSFLTPIELTMSSSACTRNDFLFELQQRRRQLTLTQKIRSLIAGSPPKNILNFTSLVNEKYVLRRLKVSEIETLEKDCRCTCDDWSRLNLLISPPDLATDDQSLHLKKYVSNTTFEGATVLGISAAVKTESVSSVYARGPIGIHNNFLISDSIISTQSWVHNNTLISDTHVYPSAVLMACGSVTASPSGSSFLAEDGSIAVNVGAENGGGRPLHLAPESTMIHVCHQLTNRGGMSQQETPTGDATVEVPNVNIISGQCVVRNTPTIQGIYLAPNSSIHAATSVSNAILFPTAKIKNTCVVENVRLQWCTSIIDNSRVSDALLMEEAHIGPNSFVVSTVLGPDVHVSAGEVHCSVLGPNTNSHHQSLVISVLWPLGRGNVGYGANIGSNHTGRIPDQETASGEGVFWGLSCAIKFPVDLTMAPYSVVAAGTTLPPQRICMPFSLVVGSNDGSNNIMPGWVLFSSPYTIARSEKKYATRRKAKRHRDYTGWKIIRSETVHMCRWARNELKRAGEQRSESSPLEFATDKIVKGIGSNILTEKARRTGIKAYTECIQRFALEGLLEWLTIKNKQGMLEKDILESEFSQDLEHEGMENVAALYDNVDWPSFPWECGLSCTWNYQKMLLREEFQLNEDVSEWIAELLENFVSLQKGYTDMIYQCKKRDDKRGAKTIPGYTASHTPAEVDEVVEDAHKKYEEMEKRALEVIAKLKQNHRSKL